MTFIKADDFKEFLNPEHITQDTPDIVLVTATDSDSSILIKSKRDYEEQITIDFTVKFSHREPQEKGTVFQREFSIEHHPPNASRHEDPHLQFHIHGANPDQKVGKLWLTLILKSDEEYEKCIEGFFLVLEDIARNCKEGIDDQLLNKEEIHKLTEQRKLLSERIRETLKTNGIEYEFPDGTTEQIFLKDVDKITTQDKTLIPLLGKKYE